MDINVFGSPLFIWMKSVKVEMHLLPYLSLLSQYNLTGIPLWYKHSKIGEAETLCETTFQGRAYQSGMR